MILFGCSFNVLASVQYPQPHPTDCIQGWKCVVGEVCVFFLYPFAIYKPDDNYLYFGTNIEEDILDRELK